MPETFETRDFFLLDLYILGQRLHDRLKTLFLFVRELDIC